MNKIHFRILTALFSFFGLFLSLLLFTALGKVVFADDFEEPGMHRNQKFHDLFYTRDEGLHDTPNLFYMLLVLALGILIGYGISKATVRIYIYFQK